MHGEKSGKWKKAKWEVFFILSNSRKICRHFAFLVYRKTIS